MRFPLSSVAPVVRPAATHDSAAIDLWRRWMLATTVGELLGFAVPALTGAAVFLAFGEPEGLAAALGFAALLVLAGAGEGAVLGTAQARVLVRAAPAVSRRAWVIATALAAALAWSIGMLPSTVIGRWQIPPLLIGIAVAVLGPVLLTSIGAAQWLVLRRSLPGAALWIPANAVAWLAGLPFTVIPSMLLPDSSPVAAFVAAGIAGGVLMGATVGAITGVALVRLLRAAPDVH